MAAHVISQLNTSIYRRAKRNTPLPVSHAFSGAWDDRTFLLSNTNQLNANLHLL